MTSITAEGEHAQIEVEGGLSVMEIACQSDGKPMSETRIARIFKNGRSQAVRLPVAFGLPGDRVRVRCAERGILLEPIVTDLDAWFAELDRFADVPLMDDGRRQPPMPDEEGIFA